MSSKKGDDHLGEAARKRHALKRHALLHGPPVTFKRARQRTESGDAAASSISTGGGAHHDRSATESAGDDRHRLSPHGLCPNVSERYEKLGRIGEGTYGVVYKARDRETGEIVALKRCLPHHEASDGFPLTTLREITVLRELSFHGHPGIVKLRDVAVSSSRSGVFLVFEFCEHDLANLIDSYFANRGRSPFKEAEVKRLSLQLLSAISFLHSRHIIHRDIKLSNLLYNHRGQLRIADFGLCRRVGRTRPSTSTSSSDGLVGRSDGPNRRVSQLPRPSSTDRHHRNPNNLTPKVVSLWYRPPELLLGSDDYDEGVDNWGAGCVIGELLTGQPLIKGKNEMDQITKMFHLLGPPDASVWPALPDMPLVKSGNLAIPRRMHVLSSAPSGSSLLDRFSDIPSAGIKLLSNLLRYDCVARWTAGEALASDYFTQPPLPTHCSLMPTFPTSHTKK